MSRDSVTVKVKGLEGVNAALNELGAKLARQSLRKGLRVVGAFWQGEVARLAPIGSVKDGDADPGELKDSIGFKVKTRGSEKKGSPASGYVLVGPQWTKGAKRTESPGLYGMFVELGLKTKKYTMHPFMRPAFDSTSDKAIALFAKTLKDDLGL